MLVMRGHQSDETLKKIGIMLSADLKVGTSTPSKRAAEGPGG